MEPWGFEPQIQPCHGRVIPFHYGPGMPDCQMYESSRRKDRVKRCERRLGGGNGEQAGAGVRGGIAAGRGQGGGRGGTRAAAGGSGRSWAGAKWVGKSRRRVGWRGWCGWAGRRDDSWAGPVTSDNRLSDKNRRIRVANKDSSGIWAIWEAGEAFSAGRICPGRAFFCAGVSRFRRKYIKIRRL